MTVCNAFSLPVTEAREEAMQALRALAQHLIPGMKDNGWIFKYLQRGGNDGVLVGSCCLFNILPL